MVFLFTLSTTFFNLGLDLTGVNTTEWNSLFNGQLDDVNSLDPMTGIQSTVQDTTAMVTSSNPQFSNNSMSNQPPGMDR